MVNSASYQNGVIPGLFLLLCRRPPYPWPGGYPDSSPLPDWGWYRTKVGNFVPFTNISFGTQLTEPSPMPIAHTPLRDLEHFLLGLLPGLAFLAVGLVVML